MSSPIRPFGDHVVLRQLDGDEYTSGGLLLPANTKNPQKMAARGEVLAIGPGRRLDNGELVPPDSEVGDVVAFSQYGGTEFEFAVGGDTYVLISDKDIYGVIMEVACEATA